LRLSRALAKGRSYRVTVTAKVASRTASRTLTIKIKK
jgi:hypothetical protein